MKISKTQEFIILGRDEFIDIAAGIDTYKGIIVIFDEDFDQRIFIFLKEHYNGIRSCVKAVYESHGTLTLFCHKLLNEYTVDIAEIGVDILDDSWNIEIRSIGG